MKFQYQTMPDGGRTDGGIARRTFLKRVRGLIVGGLIGAYILSKPLNSFGARLEETVLGPQSSQVTVDGSSFYSFNGVKEIPDGAFSVNIGDPKYHHFMKEANIKEVRLMAWLKWLSSDYCSDVPKNVSIRPDPHDSTRIDPTWWGKDMEAAFKPTGWAQDYKLRNLVDAGLEKDIMLLLMAVPPWMTTEKPFPAHPDDFAKLCVEWIKIAKKEFPTFSIKYLDVWNEPNIISPSAEDPGGLSKEYIERYCELFNVIAKAIHDNYPEIKVQGPVLAQGPYFYGGWPNFTHWMQTFIDKCSPYVDAYAWHWYGRDQDQKEPVNDSSPLYRSELAVLWNYLLINKKPLLPVTIGEINSWLSDDPQAANYAQNPDNQWKRVNWYERMLFSMLNEPDKIKNLSFHVVSYTKTFPFNLINLTVEPEKPYPIYYLFWLLRELRGERLLATSSKPQVKVISSLCPGKRKIISAIFNDQNHAESVNFNLVAPVGASITQANVEYLKWDNVAKRERYGQLFSKEIDNLRAYSLDLVCEPLSTYVLYVFLDKEVEISRTLDKKEFFGDKILVNVSSEKKAEFEVSVPKLTGVKQAKLKLGIEYIWPTPQNPEHFKGTVSVNGNIYLLPEPLFDKFPELINAVIDEDALDILEIALKKSNLKEGINEIFIHINGNYRVTFCCLEVETSEK